MSKNFNKKFLGQKELGPKKLWSIKMLSKKLRLKKNLDPKKFGYNFWKKLSKRNWDLHLKFSQN